VDDHEAIRRLLFTYAACVDAGDFEGLGALFANGEITNEGFEGSTRGHDAVRLLFEGTTRLYPETGTPRTKHVITNIVIDVDADTTTATARSYFTVFQQTPSLPLQAIIAGRYHDEFVRDEAIGAWWFSRRHIVCDLFGDLSQHLLIDLGSVTST